MSSNEYPTSMFLEGRESNLQYRQSKIQEKRKQTPWRDFIMEVASSYSLMFYKTQGLISRYATTGREGLIESVLQHNKDNFIFAEYNPRLSFCDQVKNLFLISKKPSIAHFLLNENSDYTDGAYGCKSCYINFSAGLNCENCCYSMCLINNVKNVYNSFSITDCCTNIYQSSIITNGFNIFYSFNVHNCSDVWFCSNMIGCKNCIGCNGLENQSYYIDNVKLTQEEYSIKSKQYLSQKDLFKEYFSKILIQGYNYQSINSSGSAISFSENIDGGFAVSRVTNSKNIIYGAGSELGCSYSYDCIDLCNNAHHMYANAGSGFNAEHFYCTLNSGEGINVYYSMFLESCSFCLGCIGLKNKSYCILNKQYTKEERYEKVDEIFGQMEADGTLGQFFPATMNPFYFNDTAAYLIDPSFTKEEATAKGYLRRDEPIKVDIPVGAEVVKSSELASYEYRVDETGIKIDPLSTRNPSLATEAKRHIDPSIKNKIIQDEQGNVYRIVPMEYDFLMKHGLPLPRKHWLDRMRENFRIS